MTGRQPGRLLFALPSAPSRSGAAAKVEATNRLAVGDLVSRDLGDVWRVTAIVDDYDPLRDTVSCICEQTPLGWLGGGGTRAKSWSKIGDRQTFFIADLKPAKSGPTVT